MLGAEFLVGSQAMRSRKARAVALAQLRERRLVALFAMLITLIVAIALAVAPAMAAGSGGRPSGGPTRPSNDDSPRNQDRDKPSKDQASTSDEYEDAVELIEEQKYQEAIAKLEEANAKYPGSADVLNYLGYCNRKLNQLDKAMTFYRQAIAIDSKHRGVHNYLGELFLQMDNVKKAENELMTLGLLCPDGCEEQDDLKKSIDAYKTKSASAAPTGTPE
jgi:tetratricopeptide (TPR) repeat protein